MTETTRHIRITAEYENGTQVPFAVQATLTPRDLGKMVASLMDDDPWWTPSRVYTIEADPWHQEDAK